MLLTGGQRQATTTADFDVIKQGLSAAARLGRSADDVRRELAETGKTVQFPVEVVVRTEDGPRRRT